MPRHPWSVGKTVLGDGRRGLRLADLTQTTDRAVVSGDFWGTTYLRTVAAAVVFIDQAPPATTFLHALQFQIPTAWRFTVSLPQKEHV